MRVHALVNGLKSIIWVLVLRVCLCLAASMNILAYRLKYVKYVLHIWGQLVLSDMGVVKRVVFN